MSGKDEAAEVFTVNGYPFVRCRVSLLDFDGPYEADSWRPGVEFVPAGPYGEDAEAVCDGVGSMTLRVVSRHKPAHYPERVFYVRQFTNPDGVTFGKTALRIATAEKFRRLCKGYAHEFRPRLEGEEA